MVVAAWWAAASERGFPSDVTVTFSSSRRFRQAALGFRFRSVGGVRICYYHHFQKCVLFPLLSLCRSCFLHLDHQLWDWGQKPESSAWVNTINRCYCCPLLEHYCTWLSLFSHLTLPLGGWWSDAALYLSNPQAEFKQLQFFFNQFNKTFGRFVFSGRLIFILKVLFCHFGNRLVYSGMCQSKLQCVFMVMRQHATQCTVVACWCIAVLMFFLIFCCSIPKR